MGQYQVVIHNHHLIQTKYLLKYIYVISKCIYYNNYFYFLFKKILPRTVSPSMSNENIICDTKPVFAIKSMNGSRTLPKLDLSPTSIKPNFNTASRTNNNCKLYLDKLFLMVFLIFIYFIY